MRLACDLHLHSCLSPCGGDEMTPYNLVHMAYLLGLDLIALTDHNSADNCRGALAAAQGTGLTVVPGMELNTAEEIHLVCLFPGLEEAEAFSAYVHATLTFPNDPRVFGRQVRMDGAAGVLGEEPMLLTGASGVTVDQAPGLVAGYGGVCYPAHIDRPAYSILSTLGAIEADMGFGCAELFQAGEEDALRQAHPALNKMRLLRASDAHYLENMTEAPDHLCLPDRSAAACVAYLRQFSP